MTLYPLALLPQVTITDGLAQLPFVPGTEAEYGTPEKAIAAWAEQGVVPVDRRVKRYPRQSWIETVKVDAAQAG